MNPPGSRRTAPSTRKKGRQTLPSPEIPPFAESQVADLMMVAGIRSVRSDLINEVNTLVADYLRNRSNLDHYATINQLRAGLTKIKKRARLLQNALRQSPAIENALVWEYIKYGRYQNPTGDGSKPQDYTAKLDDDFAAVDRIHELAKSTLKYQRPVPKQTAAKPELDDLSSGILDLWTGKLRRKTSGVDFGSLLSFSGIIFEHIEGSAVFEATVAARIKKAMKRRRSREGRRR